MISVGLSLVLEEFFVGREQSFGYRWHRDADDVPAVADEAGDDIFAEGRSSAGPSSVTRLSS